jgi:hypothetical protein
LGGEKVPIEETNYKWLKIEPIKLLLSESPFTLEKIVRVYRIEGEGKLTLYNKDKELIYSGVLPFEPSVPFTSDQLLLEGEENWVEIICEEGKPLFILEPFLNTTENMTVLSNAFDDDTTHIITGLDNFLFNGVSANKIYLSSNHWIGFGDRSEQLKILRRDGCSTAIYTQNAVTSNEIPFLKIRFEGYTVYNSRIESNRLIFELFLLENNDMFLNLIQTPTSSNTGTSALICNNSTTSLKLANNGEGCQVSFYHEDDAGSLWKIFYKNYTFDYNVPDDYFLVAQEGILYTFTENNWEKIQSNALTAATFLKDGFHFLPSSEHFLGLKNPEIYYWQSKPFSTFLTATLTAYPFPQYLETGLYINHYSIIGIEEITAIFDDEVKIQIALDGINFDSEILLSDWLQTDLTEIWATFKNATDLRLRFILYDTASLSEFKIIYRNEG